MIWAGMGEACGGNATHGGGVYKSVDAGRTWRNAGPDDSDHIGALREHPRGLTAKLTAVEAALYKPAHVLGVVRSSANQSTRQAYIALMGTDLAAFNKLIRDENVPAVQAPAKK